MLRVRIIKKLDSPVTLGVIGAFVAITVSLLRGIESLNFPDAIHFLEQATAINNGWQFMVANPLQLKFPFGLPVLVASTFSISNGTSLFLIKILLAVGHGFSTYLVAQIGIRMELKNWLWMGAALIFCVDPFVLSAATALQSESITTLFVLWWAFLYISSPSPKHKFLIENILFPISGFLAILVRPNILIPFLGIFTLMILRSLQNEHLKTRIISSAGLFLLLLGSFQIFLIKLYKGFVLLAPNGGINSVLTCRSEFLSQYLGFASVPENTVINRWYFQYLDSLTTNILAKQSHISIPNLYRELYSVGIDTCMSHPIQSAFLLVIKTFALWRPSTVFGAYGSEVFAISLLIWIPLTLLVIWFLWHRPVVEIPSKMRSYFIVLAIGFSVSLLPSATQIRHRVSFAEPFYWIFAAYFINVIITKKSVSK